MTIENAIKKAIKAGYIYENREDFVNQFGVYVGRFKEKSIAAILLDPQFWLYLGRNLDWIEDGAIVTKKWKNFGGAPIDYKTYQHRFIDHLIKGKTVESYFKILK